MWKGTADRSIRKRKFEKYLNFIAFKRRWFEEKEEKIVFLDFISTIRKEAERKIEEKEPERRRRRRGVRG